MNLPVDVALSVRQPWAWLLANSYKDVENRDWETSFRGPYLIHAAKKFDRDGYDWVRGAFPEIPMPLPADFERGGIVGAAVVTDCVEYLASPWFFGRYGFVQRQARPLAFIEGPGRLGFFRVDWAGLPADAQPVGDVARPRLANFHDFKSEAALTRAFGSNWRYVGRANRHYGLAKSPLANPYVNREGANGMVVANPIRAYRRWLWQQITAGDPAVLQALSEINEETVLVCWCYPEPCHAGIVDAAARWLKGRQT